MVTDKRDEKQYCDWKLTKIQKRLTLCLWCFVLRSWISSILIKSEVLSLHPYNAESIQLQCKLLIILEWGPSETGKNVKPMTNGFLQNIFKRMFQFEIIKCWLNPKVIWFWLQDTQHLNQLIFENLYRRLWMVQPSFTILVHCT